MTKCEKTAFIQIWINVFNAKLLLVNEGIVKVYISVCRRRDLAPFSSVCWSHAKIKPFARRRTAKVAMEYWPQAPRGALPIRAKLLTLPPPPPPPIKTARGLQYTEQNFCYLRNSIMPVKPPSFSCFQMRLTNLSCNFKLLRNSEIIAMRLVEFKILAWKA